MRVIIGYYKSCSVITCPQLIMCTTMFGAKYPTYCFKATVKYIGKFYA